MIKFTFILFAISGFGTNIIIFVLNFPIIIPRLVQVYNVYRKTSLTYCLKLKIIWIRKWEKLYMQSQKKINNKIVKLDFVISKKKNILWKWQVQITETWDFRQL